MCLELEGVRRLVQRDPGAERFEWQVECAGRRADVLLDEQQSSVARLGGDERQVVLAQHLLAHEPQQEPQLPRRDESIGDGHRCLAEPAADRHDLVEQITLDPGDERRERRDVGADPAGPVDDAGPIDHAGKLGPERGRQARHDLRHRFGVARLRRLQLVR